MDHLDAAVAGPDVDELELEGCPSRRSRRAQVGIEHQGIVADLRRFAPSAIIRPRSSTAMWSQTDITSPNVVFDEHDRGPLGGDLTEQGTEHGGLLVGLAGRRFVEQEDPGSVARARASSTSRALPVGISSTRASATSSSPTRSSSAGPHVLPAGPWRSLAATATFSRTVSSVKSSRRWNVRASPCRARRFGFVAGDLDIADVNGSGRRSDEAADRVEQRRLAGAVRTDEAGHVSRLGTKFDRVVARCPPKSTDRFETISGLALSHRSRLHGCRSPARGRGSRGLPR